MILHDYWRSGAAWRTRIALNLKGLSYTQVPHNLRTGAQKAPDYLEHNPQGFVPALEIDEVVITQSLAIMEWLEEVYPKPSLLPANPMDRAFVRSLCALICCDVHPLNNLRVLLALKAEYDADEARQAAWARPWIIAGFEALQNRIEGLKTPFVMGGAPGLFEACLIPQLASARRFGLDLTPWPVLTAIETAAGALEAFRRARPEAQPDADPA